MQSRRSRTQHVHQRSCSTQRQQDTQSRRACRSRGVTIVELALIGAFTAAILFAGAHYVLPDQPDIESTATIRVGPQGTLWEIAQTHPVQGLSTAQTVDVLVDLNEMEGASLRVGQTLIVPVQDGSSDTAVASR